MKTIVDEGDLLLRVAGMVPADEFHLFIVRVARLLGLRGWVRHDAYGVLIRAVGSEDQLAELVRVIRDRPPVGVSVRGMSTEAVAVTTVPVGDGFLALGPVEVGEGHGPAPQHPAPVVRVA